MYKIIGILSLVVCLMFIVSVEGAELDSGIASPDQLRSKTKLYYDGSRVYLPPELKQVAVTVQSSGFSTADSETVAHIKILPTAFWNSVEKTANNLNIPVYELTVPGLLRPVSLKSRVLDAATLQGLKNAHMEIYAKNGFLLAETYSNADGFFTLPYWLGDETTEISLRCRLDGYEEKAWVVPAKQPLGPVILTPTQKKSQDSPPPEYYMIAFRPEDGLGAFIENLHVKLEISSEQGKTGFGMLQGDGLYSTLLAGTGKQSKCVISLKDPAKKWKPFSQEIGCAEAGFIRVNLSGQGKNFAKGRITDGTCDSCRIWLLQAEGDKEEVYRHIDTVSADNEGRFSFAVEGVDHTQQYRFAVTWENTIEPDIIPAWIASGSYKPRLFGGTDDYSLGTNIELAIPANYPDIVSRMFYVRYRGAVRKASVLPQYGKNQALIAAMNKTFEQANNESSVLALNAARNFQISLADYTVSTQDNRFMKGYQIELQSSRLMPVIVSALSVGTPATVNKMHDIMTKAFSQLTEAQLVKADTIAALYQNTLLIPKDLQAQNTDRVIHINRPHPKMDFSTTLTRVFFEHLKAWQSQSNLRQNVILLLDAAFISACREDSFQLPEKYAGNLGTVSVLLFSHSYMEGDMGGHAEDIELLKKAFVKASQFQHKIVNPMETPGLVDIVKTDILRETPKPYAWIPIQAIGSQTDTDN